jgi:hypothetical protein
MSLNMLRRGAHVRSEPTYKPSSSDLEKLAQFFGVPITLFFLRQNLSHGRMRLISTTPIWKRSCCTPSSEKRGIEREDGGRTRCYRGCLV